jgi:hypothetical protein
VDNKKKKRKNKKKKNKKEEKLPTTAGHVGSDQITYGHHSGSVYGVIKSNKKNRKPKFPCRLCKGDHLLMDCPGIPKVIEVWSQVSSQFASSIIASHAGDNPFNSNYVGIRRVKSNFLACYVRRCTTPTFVPTWMKLHIY